MSETAQALDLIVQAAEAIGRVIDNADDLTLAALDVATAIEQAADTHYDDQAGFLRLVLEYVDVQ